MKLTKRLIAVAAVTTITVSSLATAAMAAPAPDPVKQALIAAQAAMRTPTKITQTIPLRTPGPKGKSVIYFNNGTPATQLIQDGIQQAATAGGWTFDSLTYNSANPATLQQAMMNALQKNPAGVIVSGETPGNWGAAVTAAYANAKVPIVAGSTCPLTQTGPIFPGAATCASPADNGRTLADWFIADSKGTGHALLQSMPSFNVFVVLREAFQAEVKAKCPACVVEVLETTLSQYAAGQIPSALVNTLRAKPDLTYLFFDNGAWARGIMPALAAAGLTDRVKVGGAGVDESGLALLKASANVAWMATSFTVYGYANFDSLLRVLTKSTGISKNSSIPIQLLTPANVGGVSLPYNAPTTALAQYKKLWKW